MLVFYVATALQENHYIEMKNNMTPSIALYLSILLKYISVGPRFNCIAMGVFLYLE